MSGQERRRIVVGVDGSPSSVRALTWAVREAGLSGGVIDAVCAWQYPVSYGWAVAEAEPQLSALSLQALEKAIAEAGAAGDTVEIRPHVVEQNPAAALLAAAKGADLLVVGSRGHGGFAGMLLGSVSQHCAHHAPCPVVVVRGEDG
ncbi:MAG TPA: universal stress protein [Streptosporangiaceae bacterium]|jgi:nucleotide-binding universal stress UspA family protein|nr:universal stress protein [Streptosporangiaceae bacterium]